MALDNYPIGFNHHTLDGETDIDILPEEDRKVTYRLMVECGEDQEQVFSQRSEDLPALLRAAESSVEQFKNKRADEILRAIIDSDL